MNVLLIGSGGREHAIAWKLKQSPLLSKLYIAPGNAGTEMEGINVALNVSDFNQVKQFVFENKINMVVVGPEAPLVEGIHDFFLNTNELKNIPVIGPTQKAAMLEGSKDFAKNFMKKYNIPTAGFKTFDTTTITDAFQYIEALTPPYVLKADGLAAGKGVLICNSQKEARDELNQMLTGKKFGRASEKVIIEDFLTGIEISVFVLTDGDDYVLLPSAKDYKRIGEKDTGLNTGGMGSISGVPFADETFMSKVEERIIKRTIDGLKNEGIKYTGFIFFGLINVNGDPLVIEYNARMGDPEAESIIPRIKSDLLELFIALAKNELNNFSIEFDPRYNAAVFLVSGGYPEEYEKGKIISGLKEVKDSIVFHAGTKTDTTTGNVLTNGGRVIAISSFGNTIGEALEKSYKSAEKIKFDKVYCRKDLGKDLQNL
ncbi:MAG: phosphoribosylamine--glycine ligase [Bacteroidales bacterium]|nr:phosphoribosylamine--glycine ligase [Bacteroidales bacterium]